AAGRAAVACEAGEGLDLGVSCGALDHRAARAPTGDRAVDETGVDVAEGFIAEAQAVNDTGPHVVDEDIGGSDELTGDVEVELGLEVEEHLALVHVPRDVADGRPVDRRRHASTERGSEDARALDMDDVGPESAQVHGRPGANHNQRQVENADAFERSSHSCPPASRLCARSHAYSSGGRG